MENNALSITQLYFDLSNAGNLSAIQALMLPEATYSSDNMGLFYGISDIMMMMEQFFKSHRSLSWQIDSIESINESITQVHFTCRKESNTGSLETLTGLERLVVVDGLIRHIEVRSAD